MHGVYCIFSKHYHVLDIPSMMHDTAWFFDVYIFFGIFLFSHVFVFWVETETTYMNGCLVDVNTVY